MYQFKVTGMTCGHCVAAIEKAVKGLDSNAEVTADLENGQVSVSSDIEVAAISHAIQEAGYENQPV